MSFNNLLSLEPDPKPMKLTASRNEFEYSNQFKSRRNQNYKRIRRKNFDVFYKMLCNRIIILQRHLTTIQIEKNVSDRGQKRVKKLKTSVGKKLIHRSSTFGLRSSWHTSLFSRQTAGRKK